MEVDGERGCLRALAASKVPESNRHVKILVSIGGGDTASSPFASVAANPQSRETFAKSARALVDKYGLDGIDSE